MLDMLDRIEAADLPPAIFRTAVRLARMTRSGAPARMSYEDAARVCGTASDNTVRGHLAALHRAGLFSYRRNALVTVWWTGDDYADGGADPDRRAVDDQNDRTARDLIAQRSPDADDVICGRSNRAVDDHEADDDPDRRAVDDQNDRTARESRGGRSNRAVDDQPNTGFKANYRLGRQAGQPSLPAMGGVRGGEPPEPPEPPEPDDGGPGQDEQQRSIDLLTDDEVGIDPDMARELAAAYPFEEIRRQVFRLRRDIQAGSVRSPGVLRTRLRHGYGASITDADRASPLWQRHETSDDREATWRKYVPDEYADIIIH